MTVAGRTLNGGDRVPPRANGVERSGTRSYQLWATPGTVPR